MNHFQHSCRLLVWSAALCLAASSVSSCVSAAKYDEMEASRNALQQRADSLSKVVSAMTRTIVRLDANIAERAQDSAQLRATIARQQGQIDSVNRLAAELLDRYTALSSTYNQLKASSTKETQKLLASLEKSQQDLNERKQEQRDKDSTLSRLQRDLVAREQRLKEVEQKLQARDAALKTLRSRVADALVGLKEGDLTLETKNGKVYVSLSNRLLFASGSTQIEAAGKNALKQLAAALNRQPDINVMVEGHTDDAKVTNLGALKDNWDLSVMRSTEVIRFLANEGKIDPKRITAAGRGEYAPLEAGSTPEIRAKNRRTEIILTPKLDELFDLVRSGQ